MSNKGMDGNSKNGAQGDDRAIYASSETDESEKGQLLSFASELKNPRANERRLAAKARSHERRAGPSSRRMGFVDERRGASRATGSLMSTEKSASKHVRRERASSLERPSFRRPGFDDLEMNATGVKPAAAAVATDNAGAAVATDNAGLAAAAVATDNAGAAVKTDNAGLAVATDNAVDKKANLLVQSAELKKANLLVQSARRGSALIRDNPGRAAKAAVAAVALAATARHVYNRYSSPKKENDPIPEMEMEKYVKSSLITLFGYHFEEQTCPLKSKGSILFGSSRGSKCVIKYSDKQIKQTIKDLQKEKHRQLLALVEVALAKKFPDYTDADRSALYEILKAGVTLGRDDRDTIPLIFKDMGITATYNAFGEGSLEVDIPR